MRHSYGFARSPRWLAGHALAGCLLVVFVIAGFWQLDRHNERRARNTATVEHQSMAPLDARGFFEAASDPVRVRELENRAARLEVAQVDWAEAVHIRNRSLGGLAGCHLAVPVATSFGGSGPDGVLVVLGWLPQQACAGGPDAVAPEYRNALDSARGIEGRVRLTQERGLLGPADPPQGRLDTLARVDVERINQQTSLELAPAYIELTAATDSSDSPIPIDPTRAVGAATSPDLDDATVPGAAWPIPLPDPELDAGPHLGYALQWFSFIAVTVIGYALVLRHQARKGPSQLPPDD